MNLIQKPHQFGLLKRGLGGLSNDELLESSKISFKKEPRSLAMQTKLTAMILTPADVQQRIGDLHKSILNKPKYGFTTKCMLESYYGV